MLTRRAFLRRVWQAVSGAIGIAGAAAIAFRRHAAARTGAARWVFLVDTYKCVGCGFCVRACKLENGVPYEANVTRTWVERYILTKKGELLIDTPKGARDGFISPKVQIGKDTYREVEPNEIAKAFFVPKLCNQCENPPCVQVCPVGATYQTEDGVVLVDRKWCIGCGYCIMACPYGVRFLHPVYKVADKCNFCYHRISQGMKPACVEACPFGARLIGDLNNPDDPVTRYIMTQRVGVLKEDYGTKPQVYYVGLSKEVR